MIEFNEKIIYTCTRSKLDKKTTKEENAVRKLLILFLATLLLVGCGGPKGPKNVTQNTEAIDYLNDKGLTELYIDGNVVKLYDSVATLYDYGWTVQNGSLNKLSIDDLDKDVIYSKTYSELDFYKNGSGISLTVTVVNPTDSRIIFSEAKIVGIKLKINDENATDDAFILVGGIYKNSTPNDVVAVGKVHDISLEGVAGLAKDDIEATFVFNEGGTGIVTVQYTDTAALNGLEKYSKYYVGNDVNKYLTRSSYKEGAIKYKGVITTTKFGSDEVKKQSVFVFSDASGEEFVIDFDDDWNGTKPKFKVGDKIKLYYTFTSSVSNGNGRTTILKAKVIEVNGVLHSGF